MRKFIAADNYTVNSFIASKGKLVNVRFMERSKKHVFKVSGQNNRSVCFCSSLHITDKKPDFSLSDTE